MKEKERSHQNMKEKNSLYELLVESVFKQKTFNIAHVYPKKTPQERKSEKIEEIKVEYNKGCEYHVSRRSV